MTGQPDVASALTDVQGWTKKEKQVVHRLQKAEDAKTVLSVLRDYRAAEAHYLVLRLIGFSESEVDEAFEEVPV